MQNSQWLTFFQCFTDSIFTAVFLPGNDAVSGNPEESAARN